MAFLLLLWPGTTASAAPPPLLPLGSANVHCAYATEDLTAVYATEDGSAVYAPAECFLPGASISVGWPDPHRKKRVREAVERLLKLQKDNTFGRRWFARFEEALREFEAAEAEDAEEIEVEEFWEPEPEEIREAAGVITSTPVSRSRPDEILKIFAAANLIKIWLEEYEREREDEEEILLLME